MLSRVGFISNPPITVSNTNSRIINRQHNIALNHGAQIAKKYPSFENIQGGNPLFFQNPQSQNGESDKQKHIESKLKLSADDFIPSTQAEADRYIELVKQKLEKTDNLKPYGAPYVHFSRDERKKNKVMIYGESDLQYASFYLKDKDSDIEVHVHIEANVKTERFDIVCINVYKDHERKARYIDDKLTVQQKSNLESILEPFVNGWLKRDLVRPKWDHHEVNLIEGEKIAERFPTLRYYSGDNALLYADTNQGIQTAFKLGLFFFVITWSLLCLSTTV